LKIACRLEFACGLKPFSTSSPSARFVGKATAITNARLRGRDGLWDIEVNRGRVGRISRFRGKRKGEAFDAGGCLATEPFVVAHIHLDKVRTAGRVATEALAAYQGSRMDTRRSILLASKVKESYREADIVGRAREVVDGALRYGVTSMRAFADTDTVSQLKAVRALIMLRREFAGRLAIQVVAFPQEGIESDPGAEEYVEKAIEAGADVVGGIPWLEKGEPKQRRHLDKMFAIAKKHSKPIAMLVDDAGDPGLRTLEMLARKTLKEGMNGRVQACHARAMQLYPEGYAREVAKLCARAGVGVVSSPHTGPLHARIDLLEKYGVTLALGQDDCADAYYPYGRCNMLEVAFLASHILRKMLPRDAEELYDMITVNAAKIVGEMGMLSEGSTASLVVLAARSVTEALSGHQEPMLVVNRGSVVFQNLPGLRTGGY
jgi:cytosine deaminase